MPSFNGCFADHPSDSIRALLKFRQWTPTGPSTYRTSTRLPATSMIVSTSSATVTYSGLPMLTGPSRSGLHEANDALDHVVDVGVGPHRRSVAPDLDGAAVLNCGHLAAQGGGCLLLPSLPCAIGAVAILEPRDSHLTAVPPAVCLCEPPRVQLLPAILFV